MENELPTGQHQRPDLMQNNDIHLELASYVTIKMLVASGFSLVSAILIPSIIAFFFVMDLKISPILENVKRNELRNVRTEGLLLKQGESLTTALDAINLVLTNVQSEVAGIRGDFKHSQNTMPLIYETKEGASTKYVDKKTVDSRLLKTAYKPN